MFHFWGTHKSSAVTLVWSDLASTMVTSPLRGHMEKATAWHSEPFTVSKHTHTHTYTHTHTQYGYYGRYEDPSFPENLLEAMSGEVDFRISDTSFWGHLIHRQTLTASTLSFYQQAVQCLHSHKSARTQLSVSMSVCLVHTWPSSGVQVLPVVCQRGGPMSPAGCVD